MLATYSAPRQDRRITVLNKLLASVIAVLGFSGLVQAQTARDYISIVGSSTVYPFTTTVAEQFGRGGQFKTPKVESTGTGGGIKLFCNGVGVQHPDVANASRRIKASEIAQCAKNGVRDVSEVKIGYDGIVLARSKQGTPFKLSRRDVYLALAKQVPDAANPQTLIANPYTTWKQVNPALPNQRIEVLGPPPTSGTRDAFVELYLEQGCSTYSWIKALKDIDEGRFRRVCHTVREDGAYVEAGENDNLIVQKLGANPNALGVFGFSFLEENEDKLHGSVLEGVAPTFEAIASGKYPASRALYIYVKKAHMGVIPGLKEFVAEYVSDKAIGEEGYLADKGLIPPSGNEAGRIRADALAAKNVKL
jgi:phosphate transport system substrate-binding protein